MKPEPSQWEPAQKTIEASPTGLNGIREDVASKLKREFTESGVEMSRVEG